MKRFGFEFYRLISDVEANSLGETEGLFRAVAFMSESEA